MHTTTARSSTRWVRRSLTLASAPASTVSQLVRDRRRRCCPAPQCRRSPEPRRQFRCRGVGVGGRQL